MNHDTTRAGSRYRLRDNIARRRRFAFEICERRDMLAGAFDRLLLEPNTIPENSAAGTLVGQAAIDLSPAGATVPWTRYEAEEGTHGGGANVLGPNREIGDPAGEAAGRMAVRLASTGQFVQWKAIAQANAVVVRLSIPDAPTGGGIDSTLGLYRNGVKLRDLEVTSRYAWLYGDDNQVTNDPADGPARRIYDETFTLLGTTIAPGDMIRLQKDAVNNAAHYDIDFLETEFTSPFARPANSISITEEGAIANDSLDDPPAIEATIARAKTEGKSVWMPEGRFLQSRTIDAEGVTIRGAGMWHTELWGYRSGEEGAAGEHAVGFYVTGGNTKFYDFRVKGERTSRLPVGKAFTGPFGIGSEIHNVWVEHTECGVWVGVDNSPAPAERVVITGSRFRNTFADGVNLCNGTIDSLVENNTARNTGDDAFAMWSEGMASRANSGNVIRNNTAENVWKAAGFAVYGGANNAIERNLSLDTLTYPGITIGAAFASYPFAGVTTIRDNALIRCGGLAWNQGHGAIGVLIDDMGINSEINVTGNVIRDATYAAFEFSASDLGNRIDGAVTFAENVVEGAERLVYSAYYTLGSVELVGTLYSGLREPDLILDETSGRFVVNQSGTSPFEYRLTPSPGSGDNSAFSLSPSGELRAAQAFDFETRSNFAPHTAIVATADLSARFSTSLNVKISDVNESPSISLANSSALLTENMPRPNSILLTTFTIENDALGSAIVSLAGPDAAAFTLVAGRELHLAPYTALDFETKPRLDVWVEVDDPAIGSSPDSRAVFTLNVSDLREFAGTSGNDLFTIAATAIPGEAAVSRGGVLLGKVLGGAFAIEAGTGADSVTIVGTSGTDDFTLGDDFAVWLQRNVTVYFRDVETRLLLGREGDDRVTDLGGRGIFDGGLGNDRVVGNTRANVWSTTGAGVGVLNARLEYRAVERLNGGALSDLFSFGNSGSLSLGIDGGEGLDTLDYSPRTTSAAVLLGSSRGTGVPLFAGIERFRGSQALDSITGPPVMNLWQISSPNGGTIAGREFIGFETLYGGAAADRFAILPGGSISGTIDGVGGIDTLDCSLRTDPVWVSLPLAKTSLVAKFAAIEQFEASLNLDRTDVLIGPKISTNWTITGLNAGTVGSIVFIGFEYLAGLEGNDRFTFQQGGSITGRVSGGSGIDTLDFTPRTTAVAIDLAANTGTAVAAFDTIESLIASSTVGRIDTLIGPNAANLWSLMGTNSGKINAIDFVGFDELLGGSADDSLLIYPAGKLSGRFLGRGGRDFLDYRLFTNAVSVNVTHGTASALGGIGEIELLRGGRGNDLLVGTGADDWIFGGDGNDMIGGLGGNDVLCGGKGNDLLVGSEGRDWLIGGSGIDAMFAGIDDDILIGGTSESFYNETSQTFNASAIQAIMSEWTRNDAAYAIRLQHLRSSGGLNASTQLTAGSDSTALDSFTGDLGSDWFFASLTETPSDLALDETKTIV